MGIVGGEGGSPPGSAGIPAWRGKNRPACTGILYREDHEIEILGSGQAGALNDGGCLFIINNLPRPRQGLNFMLPVVIHRNFPDTHGWQLGKVVWSRRTITQEGQFETTIRIEYFAAYVEPEELGKRAVGRLTVADHLYIVYNLKK